MKRSGSAKRIIVKMQYLGPTGYYYTHGKKYRFSFKDDENIEFPCQLRSPKNRKTGQQSVINYYTEEEFEKEWKIVD